MPIRVVIAEDQGMVLGALAALLSLDDDIHVIGQARNGREALALVLSEHPDVLISDIEMPGSLALSTRVIILTTFARSVICAVPWMPAGAVMS